MANFNEIKIIDEFRKCIESLDEQARNMFDFYCLGKRQNAESAIVVPGYGDAYTFDEYISLLEKSLKEQSSLGHRYVVYKALTNDKRLVSRSYWSIDKKNTYNSCYYYGNNHSKNDELLYRYNKSHINAYECYVPKLTNKKAKFKFDFETLNANACMVFLLHPSILSYDCDEIALFASVWDEWFNNVINIFPVQKFRFYFGNRKNIYSGDLPPSHEEIKRCKINTSFNLPIESLSYENF